MTTTFVLDTNVLLSAGKKALYSFGGDDVVVPFTVLTELESKKNHPELGYYARSAIKELDRLGEEGDILNGVSLGDKAGSVYILLNDAVQDHRNNDSVIIKAARDMRKVHAEVYPDDNVVLVTKDFAMRIIARLYGIETQDFEIKSTGDEFIDEIPTYYVSSEQIRELHGTRTVKLDFDVPRNVGAILRSNENPKDTALVVSGKEYQFDKVEVDGIAGLQSKNAEQALAINYLMDPDIKIVSLGGRAGTGKTTLALAAAVQQYFDGEIKKIIVFRSMQAVGGEEMGFLPGTEAEKLDPWTKAVYQSLGSFLQPHEVKHLRERNVFEVQPLTYIRGQNLNSTFVLVDEAQNLDKSVIMTVLTRLGKGSKAALSWDVSQRDNHRVGRHDGIYTAVSRLLGEKLFAHVSLHRSQRSEVSDMVARKLDDFV